MNTAGTAESLPYATLQNHVRSASYLFGKSEHQLQTNSYRFPCRLLCAALSALFEVGRGCTVLLATRVLTDVGTKV